MLASDCICRHYTAQTAWRFRVHGRALVLLWFCRTTQRSSLGNMKKKRWQKGAAAHGFMILAAVTCTVLLSPHEIILATVFSAFSMWSRRPNLHNYYSAHTQTPKLMWQCTVEMENWWCSWDYTNEIISIPFSEACHPFSCLYQHSVRVC